MSFIVSFQTALLVIGFRRFSDASVGRLINAFNDEVERNKKASADDPPKSIVIRVFVGDALKEGFRVVRTRKNPPTVEYRFLAESLRGVPPDQDAYLAIALIADGIRKLGLQDNLNAEAQKLIDSASEQVCHLAKLLNRVCGFS